MMRNDRGVALLIVLLVTALLIALIFEFAYGTRVSLRGAVNFRDSQRAYYLARSGVNFAGMLMSENLKANLPQANLEQREWQPVPLVGESDAEIRVRWEDEGGKINISTVVKPYDAYKRLSILFDLLGISQDNLDRISAWMIEEKRNFRLITELHQFLSEEEYAKVKDFVTVSPIVLININTASSEVLQSLGLSPGQAGMIVDRRNREPFTKQEDMSALLGPEGARFVGMLNVTSDVFKVNSFATVGGYTKQIEAGITRSSTGFTISYWRAL